MRLFIWGLALSVSYFLIYFVDSTKLQRYRKSLRYGGYKCSPTFFLDVYVPQKCLSCIVVLEFEVMFLWSAKMIFVDCLLMQMLCSKFREFNEGHKPPKFYWCNMMHNCFVGNFVLTLLRAQLPCL